MVTQTINPGGDGDDPEGDDCEWVTVRIDGQEVDEVTLCYPSGHRVTYAGPFSYEDGEMIADHVQEHTLNGIGGRPLMIHIDELE